MTVNHLDPDGNWLGSDPDAAFDTLSAAAGTTRALAAQGCRFAVAPVPDQAGVLVRRVLPGWAMQVFPYLEGWSTADGSWQDPKERTRIAALVGRLHAAAVPSGVPRWTFVIPCWSALTGAHQRLTVRNARRRRRRRTHPPHLILTQRGTRGRSGNSRRPAGGR